MGVASFSASSHKGGCYGCWLYSPIVKPAFGIAVGILDHSAFALNLASKKSYPFHVAFAVDYIHLYMGFVRK